MCLCCLETRLQTQCKQCLPEVRTLCKGACIAAAILYLAATAVSNVIIQTLMMCMMHEYASVNQIEYEVQVD